MTDTQQLAADQPSESVIRRIQNLLSLAARAEGNEEEAASANAMAQKLLAKHNLDYYQVQQAQVAGGTNVIEEKRDKTLIGYSAMYRWQRDLWKTIAESNFCYHWITERRVPHRRQKERMVLAKRHMLLGRESNVIAVRLMGEYLCDTLERILPYPNTERMSRSAISWRAGCAERLVERIQEQYEAQQKEAKAAASGPSTALTLLDVASREEMANYDAKYGKGAWAEQKKHEAEWKADAPAREAEAKERRVKEEKEWLEYLQTETPQQKARREKEDEKERLREDRESRRWRDKYWRERERESSKTDHGAYSAGRAHGDSISLSKQAGAGTKAKELS